MSKTSNSGGHVDVYCSTFTLRKLLAVIGNALLGMCPAIANYI